LKSTSVASSIATALAYAGPKRFICSAKNSVVSP
jgi:hypothetical protein